VYGGKGCSRHVFGLKGREAGGDGDDQAGVGGVMDFVRDATTLAAEKEDVAGTECEVRIGKGGAGGEEDEACPRVLAPGLEIGPGGRITRQSVTMDV